MTQALARVRNDILARKIDLQRAGAALLPRIAAKVLSLPPRVYLAIVFCAVIGGIAANGLILQRGRHPAPLFASTGTPPAPVHTKMENPAPPRNPPIEAPAAAASAPSVSPPAAAPIPPPAVRHGEVAKAVSRRSGDPIGELLNQEKTEESNRLLETARAALVKLGYPLKPDSNGAAVREAVREFERSRGWPVMQDITPLIVRRLSEAAPAPR